MSQETAVPATIDLSKYIDRKYFGERPHIRGRRVWVTMIAANAPRLSWNIQELADEFTLSEEQVLAALLYYREHQQELDAQDAEEQRLWDEMAQQHRHKQKK
ncbi:MAG: DUF433 domain-containing protein [bacterium]|nr:DUF433 domain-containing protein [bacterium]